MKRFFIMAAFAGCMAVGATAQNVQLHYDFGRSMYDEFEGRPLLTSTVEMFRPDKWGSTFFFVDMDYKSDGVASAYWEIARELKFWDGPLSAHIEYDGGLQYVKNAYLAGVTYSCNSADFSRTFSLSAMYKYIQKHYSSEHNFQITAVWGMHFCDGKYSFTGFADLWREKQQIAGEERDFVFLTEPQFWINLNKFDAISDDLKLSVGTEWEISNNFAARDGFYVIPTLAIKWQFD